MNGVVLAGETLVFLGRIGWKGLRRTLPALGIVASVLVAEWMVLSRLHWLFPKILEGAFAPFLAATVSSSFVFLRVVVVGAAVAVLFVPMDTDRPGKGRFNRRYWTPWSAIAAGFSVGLFALEAAQIQLQFGGAEPLDPVAGIGLTLGLYYCQIVLLGLAACLFAACPIYLTAERDTGMTLWQFSKNHRLAICVAGLIVYLLVEKVLLPVLLYLPFVAPFWTMTSELSEIRHYAVQTATIIAQSLSVLIYAAFVLSAHEMSRRSGTPSDRTSPIR